MVWGGQKVNVIIWTWTQNNTRVPWGRFFYLASGKKVSLSQEWSRGKCFLGDKQDEIVGNARGVWAWATRNVCQQLLGVDNLSRKMH